MRPTAEPSGGVSGAMDVPTEEAQPAETPSSDVSPEAAMDQCGGQENANGDIEMDFVGNINASQGLGSLEPSFDDEVSDMLLAEMGSSGRIQRKDGRKAVRKLVSEIYSPPRVTELLRRTRSRHLMAGFALDLTVTDEDGTPWDFTLRHKREKARRMIREQKPYMLIGSPACKGFSTWQALNLSKSKDPEAMRKAKVASIVHLDFVASLCREQADGGRYFLHEHPLQATSWRVTSIEQVLNRPDVERVHGDQCQFGGSRAARETEGRTDQEAQRLHDQLVERGSSARGAVQRPRRSLLAC